MKQFSKDLGNVSLAPKGKWSKEQEYERLALVYNAYNNLSYVAKINVPNGVDIENREYWQPMNATGYADNNFINLTTENENGTITAYESLEEAVATILPINRRAGATLSFYNLNSDRLDRQAEFELWQFNSTDLANWENKNYWNNIYYNWNVFAGWYIGDDALKNHVKIPNVGQYAYVGSNLNDAILYQCRTNGTWTNTGIKVRNYISVVVGGNITIGENGNWFSNGKDTGIPATPAVDEQLDNIIMQLQQHTTEINNLKESNANLQNQITSNDTDIATLNAKHESLSKTVQGIAATGGASTANNVTYNNDASGLNAENAQAAIDEVSSMIIYDVSAHNNGAVFESLQALLSSSNLSTLIPTSVRHGGMSIRFIQGSLSSSDNKYVQFRYMESDATTVATFTNVANWQGVDDKVAVNGNLPTGKSVADYVGLPALYASQSWSEISTGTIGTLSMKAGKTYIIEMNRSGRTAASSVLICSGTWNNPDTVYLDMSFGENVTNVKKQYIATEDIEANIVIQGTHIQSIIPSLTMTVTESHNNIVWTEEQSLNDSEKRQVLENIGAKDIFDSILNDGKNIDFSQLTHYNGIVYSNGVWIIANNSWHYLLPLNKNCSEVYVKAKTEPDYAKSYIIFLENEPTYPIVNETSINGRYQYEEVDVNTSRVIEKPDFANYLCVLGRAMGNYHTPDELTLLNNSTHRLRGMINTLNLEVGDTVKTVLGDSTIIGVSSLELKAGYIDINKSKWNLTYPGGSTNNKHSLYELSDSDEYVLVEASAFKSQVAFLSALPTYPIVDGSDINGLLAYKTILEETTEKLPIPIGSKYLYIVQRLAGNSFAPQSVTVITKPVSDVVRQLSTIERSPLYVAADGSGAFTSLHEAMKFCASNPDINYEVHIKEGVYDVGADWSTEELDNADYPNGFYGTIIPSNVNLIGDGNKENIIITAESNNDYTWKDTWKHISTLNVHGGSVLENVTVKAFGELRYTIHHDFATAANKKTVYRNCDILFSNDNNKTALGCGSNSGESLTVENCIIMPKMGYHSNNKFTKDCELNIYNTVIGALWLVDYNARVKIKVNIVETQCPYVLYSTNTENIKQWMDFNIVGCMMAFITKLSNINYHMTGITRKTSIPNTNITKGSPVAIRQGNLYQVVQITSANGFYGIALDNIPMTDGSDGVVWGKVLHHGYVPSTLLGLTGLSIGDKIGIVNGSYQVVNSDEIGVVEFFYDSVAYILI